jgi:hypothetical protein
MTADTIIVVLGNTNDANGRLSPTAVSRLDTALGYFRSLSDVEKEGTRLVTTGGFGAFNPSSIPHGELMNRYLIANGLAETVLLPYIHSHGTIDDGVKTARLVAERGPEGLHLVLVTSAFHMPRAGEIFTRLMPGVRLSTVADGNMGTPEQQLHERRAMATLDLDLSAATTSRLKF